MQIEIVRREWHIEIRIRFYFGLTGDFPGIETGIARIEHVADHAVAGLAVVDVEIMGSGIFVHVRAQATGLAMEFEDGLCRIKQRLHGVVGGKAAIVLGVVGQQGRASAHHGGEMRVIGDRGQVIRRLLGIAEIGWKFGACAEAGITSNRIAKRDPRIERADDDRLPAPAGQAAHRHARRVGLWQRQQDVDPA